MGAWIETVKPQRDLVTMESRPAWARGLKLSKSCVDHELGHQLDNLLLLSAKSTINKLYAEAKKAGITKSVSTYAGQNIAEFIAECWSEALNNLNPRHYATEVARIIRDEYTKQFPS